MKAHIERIRANLGELGALADKTEKAERAILQRAEARLTQVSSLIERARPGVEAADDGGQQRYLDLVAERGLLQTVIAKAQQALA
ncbi:hypothetical protein M2281_003742 [Mesorhizobium soli]|uniref:hypothetical protein n=1 Tax=Pseudaminobacter soli (ex Li et al. 2025) TaxID=1295366 RepID=UPI0024745F47|nr:hypothetical protein [Mesorhizobium soli]MDH6233131.1 hypothetical protein [Mesorhizobium soli]